MPPGRVMLGYGSNLPGRRERGAPSQEVLLAPPAGALAPRCRVLLCPVSAAHRSLGSWLGAHPWRAKGLAPRWRGPNMRPTLTTGFACGARREVPICARGSTSIAAVLARRSVGLVVRICGYEPSLAGRGGLEVVGRTSKSCLEQKSRSYRIRRRSWLGSLGSQGRPCSPPPEARRSPGPPSAPRPSGLAPSRCSGRR